MNSDLVQVGRGISISDKIGIGIGYWKNNMPYGQDFIRFSPEGKVIMGSYGKNKVWVGRKADLDLGQYSQKFTSIYPS